MNTKTDQTVAREIYRQLGGTQFRCMTGAYCIVCDNDTLSFSIMRNAKKITHIQIELNLNDYYDMKFYSFPNHEPVEIVTDVDCDNLQDVFESETGLYTHL